MVPISDTVWRIMSYSEDRRDRMRIELAEEPVSVVWA